MPPRATGGEPFSRRSPVGPLLSKARFVRDLLVGKLLHRKAPLLLYWFVTNRCNYRCSYCYGLFPQDPRPDLPTDVMLGMIDEMARAGVRRVNLIGGEPLMREDLGLLVDRLAARKISICLLTNGAFLPERLPVMRSLSEVGMSIDGRKDIHDAIRGRGAFEELTLAVAACRRQGIPVVLTYTMVSQNIDHLGDVMEFARREGAQVTINVAHGRVFGAKDLPVSRVGNEGYRRALRTIIDYQSRGYPVFRARRTLELMLRWRDYGVDTSDTAPSGDFPRCRFGSYGATLCTDGSLIPCFLNSHAGAGLRVPESGFASAWRHCQGMPHCAYCHVPCFIEYNSIFALSLPVLWNAGVKLCLFPALKRT